MPVEMSLADFVLQILINCGKSETVVNRAATKPTIVMASISLLFVSLEYLVFDLKYSFQMKIELCVVNFLNDEACL